MSTIKQPADPAHRLLPLLGLPVWLILAVFFLPESALRLDYVRLLLVAAPLVILPLSRAADDEFRLLDLILALAFALGILLPAAWWSVALVIPWWLFAAEWSIRRFREWAAGSGSLRVNDLLRTAEPLFLLTAACWAIAERAGWSVMGFDATITLLTAVHFHYAGYALAWLTRRHPTLPAFLRWGVLAGVPLVALGITTTQYDLPHMIEIVSVTLMAAAGAGGGSSLPAIRIPFALGISPVPRLGAGWSGPPARDADRAGLWLAQCFSGGVFEYPADVCAARFA